MKRTLLIIFLLGLLTFISKAQMMSPDSLNVSKEEVVNAQLKKLTRELDLTKEQQTEIKKLLQEDSMQKDAVLLQLLSSQQKETFKRLLEIDQKGNIALKSSNHLKSSQSSSQYSLILNSASNIKEVMIGINNHPNGSHSENTNYSTYNKIAMHAWTYSGSTMYKRSAMKFVLNEIPVGSEIVSATLYFYSDPTRTSTSDGEGNSQLSGSNAFYIERIIQDWNEQTVTWNTQPTSITDGRILIPASFSTTENIQIDLTNMVQTWINTPSLNYGIKLFLQTESHYRSRHYGSTEHTNSGIHPKLIIEYNIPSIEFTYDASGNRVQRKIITLESSPLKSSSASEDEPEQLFEEKLAGQRIRIYPNPTEGHLMVSIIPIENNPKGKIAITDINGKLLITKKIEGINTSLNLSNQPAGYYLMTITLDTESSVWKIVKK